MSASFTPAITIMLLALMAGSGQTADKAAVKCSTGKQKAAVKKIGSKLKCHQKANAADLPVDQECLTKAETKFSDTIVKIEAKGGCIITGDEAVIEQAADECIDDIRGLTPVSPPTCGGSGYPECGGTCPAGQACQAMLVTTFESGGGGGTGGTETCAATCACVDPTVACNGGPCGRICQRSTIFRSSGPDTTETCCGGFGNRCDATTGNPSCCCTGACFDPPFGGGSGTCLETPSCNGTQRVCG
jgi:hypothetical protein